MDGLAREKCRNGQQNTDVEDGKRADGAAQIGESFQPDLASGEEGLEGVGGKEEGDIWGGHWKARREVGGARIHDIRRYLFQAVMRG